jgi:hypothetical protein
MAAGSGEDYGCGLNGAIVDGGERNNSKKLRAFEIEDPQISAN